MSEGEKMSEGERETAGMRVMFWTWMAIVWVGLAAMIATPLGGR